MDPEIAKLVAELGGGAGVSVWEIAAGTAPQTSVLGYALWSAWKRIKEAEAKLEATLGLCKELVTLHESNDSMVHITAILEGLVIKDKTQHAHNRWTQSALLKLVRRGGGNAEVDELELGQPSGEGG